jgi:hypothetical protein
MFRAAAVPAAGLAFIILTGLTGLTGTTGATAAAAVPTAAEAPGGGRPRPTARGADGCAPGEFCAWPQEDYGGTRHSWDLTTVGTDECVPFPAGLDARSLANRTGRRATVYQSRECATEAEFDTLPKFGSFVPRVSYAVRAVQLQE